MYNDLHLFPLKTSKTRKTVEEATKRVPKSFTAVDGIEQGHRRGSSIRCLRGGGGSSCYVSVYTLLTVRARAHLHPHLLPRTFLRYNIYITRHTNTHR